LVRCARSPPTVVSRFSSSSAAPSEGAVRRRTRRAQRIRRA
jgi:hypothetical protein